MARVVVVGGGFAGLASAARLAKLRHEVVLLESAEELGGRLRNVRRGTGAWQICPDTMTLPGVVRDLFRKSGRPLDKALDLETVPGRRHVFADRSSLDLPMGRRSDQHDAVTGLLGADPWSPWLDTMPESWDVLRRRTIHTLPSGHGTLDRAARKNLAVRRSLRRAARMAFKDRRLRAMVVDAARLDGDDDRVTPAFTAVTHYLERNFGRWRVVGGMPALADALTQRLAERRVTTHLGVRAHGLEVSADGAVRAVLTEDERYEADVVVWAAGTWPRPLPPPKLLPCIPATRTLVRLGPEAPMLPHDIATHGDPPMRLWSDGSDCWTITHHNAEDPITALARVGIDLREQVEERHDLRPTELVLQTHWGWQWRGWASQVNRPSRPGPDGLFMVGAHAHPGPGLELIGLAAEAVAEHLGPVPRR
ncbi:phytoene desaturase family protein [Aeromicrobium sp. CTD01-1L150]|uniref:phytoene desaturase family protein n=1 Tax=Aeromicrobium sp. CTD01-1L150 TaxID=3341830 RepID=UPI0035C2065B